MDFKKSFGELSEIEDSELREQFRGFEGINAQIDICEHTGEEVSVAISNVLTFRNSEGPYLINHGLHTHIEMLLDNNIDVDTIREYAAYKFSSLYLVKEAIKDLYEEGDSLDGIFSLLEQNDGFEIILSVKEEGSVKYFFPKNIAYINMYLGIISIYDVLEKVGDRDVFLDFRK